MARIAIPGNATWALSSDLNGSVVVLEEPYLLHPEDYIWAAAGNAEKVFSHHKEYVERYDNWYYYPLGGTFIGPDSRVLWGKPKLVSMFLSGKNTMPGHHLRHRLYKGIHSLVDGYGYGADNYINCKIDGLRGYAFSIAIESCRERGYFTEKLIDCFLTGTIPIYWGDPDIKEHFNTDGMFIMPEESTSNDLSYLLGKIYRYSDEIRQKMDNARVENYYKAFDYIDHRKWLEEHYPETFNDQSLHSS